MNESENAVSEQDYCWNAASFCVNEPLKDFHGGCVTSCQEIKIEGFDLNCIKEECEDVIKFEDEQVLFTRASMHRDGEKNCANISINEVVYLFEKYVMISLEKRNQMKCKFLRLVECPICVREYKNSPDRLIRLYNHVLKFHQKNKEFLLKEIFYKYYPLVKFIENEVKSAFSNGIEKEEP